MVKISTFALLLATVISPALAIVKFPIARRDDAPANFMSRRHLQERATITESLLNNQSLYMATVSVGTPAQSLAIDIDTGSSDVYVLDKNADQCVSASVQAAYGGCFGGTFDSSKSSTFKNISTGFSVKYGDTSGATGDFITDNFGIGGVTIQNLIMGLATQTTTGSGLMGIGYDTLEAGFQNGDLSKPYKSIIDTMVDQGLINTKSYSLYLDDLTAKTGSVIFGGADTQKFIGPLKVLPIVAENGVYQEMLVTMTAISITNQTGVNTALTNSAFSVPALLDSGTSLTYLPTTIYNEFATAFSATNQDGDLIVDCGYRNTQSRGYVSWTFGGSSGVTINVPIDELIVTIPGYTKDCLLGVQEASKIVILGDVFLRSAYVVYDLTNNQIGMAQTNFESTSSNLVEFKATDSGIPTLTGVSSGQTIEPGTSGKSAAAMVPPLEKGALVVFALSGLFSLLGGVWFLI